MGTVAVSEFSIKKYLNKKEEGENEVLNLEDDLPEDDFSENDLQEEWRQFLRELAVEEYLIFIAVNNFKVKKLAKNQIEISYSSESARGEFEKVEGDFLGRFRQKVNNFKVEIIYKDNPNLRTVHLTKRKMFDKLLEINPVLKDLEDLMKFDFS